MTVRVSHLVAGLIGVIVLVGAAFSFGTQWGGEGGSGVEVAAATSTLESSEEEKELEESPARSGDAELYDVVKVIDGDTITIAMNGKNETVRLIGIDTPETVDTRTDVQCFGAEASAKAKTLLNGRRVSLELDEGEGERDKYDRLLAYVFRDDGLHVNKYLIEEGFAYEYTYDAAYAYQKEFKAAEANAKNAQKGLWAPDACPKPEVQGATVAPKKEETAASPAPPETPPTPESEPEPQEDSEPEPQPSNSTYTCSSNTYNCSDFKTHAEAQAVYDQCGGADNDVHKLDSNKDGEACESLP